MLYCYLWKNKDEVDSPHSQFMSAVLYTIWSAHPIANCILEASSSRTCSETMHCRAPPLNFTYFTPTQFADHSIQYQEKLKPESSWRSLQAKEGSDYSNLASGSYIHFLFIRYQLFINSTLSTGQTVSYLERKGKQVR